MSECCMRLDVPILDTYLEPGYKIKLGRFDCCKWIVLYGWYTVRGNRPVCGWYLKSDGEIVRPLQLTDLEDIYIIER